MSINKLSAMDVVRKQLGLPPLSSLKPPVMVRGKRKMIEFDKATTDEIKAAVPVVFDTAGDLQIEEDGA